MGAYRDFVDSQYDKEFDFDFDGETTRTLVIASSPRSGSHMFGHLLHQTELMGHPLEYMQPSHHARWKQRYGLAGTADTLRAVMSDRTTPNGIFSIKLHYPHLVALGGISGLTSLFPDPRVILLRRRDTVGQAVSLAIARQSGLWFGESPDESEVAYDRLQIDRALADAVGQTADWRFDLIRSGLPLLELDFEDVRRDVRGAVRSVAEFADIAIPDDRLPDAPKTRRQSNDINAVWRSRYLSDAASVPSTGVTGRWAPADGVLERVRAVARRAKRKIRR